MENDILIDFKFKAKEKPRFGDLFLITGDEHPKFPSKSKSFAQLAPLGFEQLDDFFGILNSEETGDDVLIWLFPMLNGEEVFLGSGPFDAVRLSYSALRNSPVNISLLEECFLAFKNLPDTTVIFEDKPITDFAVVKAKVDEIIAHWRANGVEPGSDESLLIDEEEDEDWEDEEWNDEDWEDPDQDYKKN